MPELPEITQLARQMNAALPGKKFSRFEIGQPKCLNIEPDAFVQALTSAEILSACNRGKWILVETTRGWLLLNLGMGGEILLTDHDHLPAKRRIILDFTDGSCLSLNFWWFGYTHYVPTDALETHKMTARLGPNALDLDAAAFAARFDGQRSAIKTLLLDQTRVAGIGNFYIHDILFCAQLHPLRRANTLTPAEMRALWVAMQDRLEFSLNQHGAEYEVDLFGQKGGYRFSHLIIGYQEGKLCPVCGATIEKIKTGGTSSFICPQCQK